MPAARSVKLCGFTLIELLVVLAIVAILAGLLFSVFSRARESGRRTQCQSNLRQIALAVQQYVQDNDGRFPIVLYVQNKNTPQAVAVKWNDAVFPYLKTADVYHCLNSVLRDFSPDAIDYEFNDRRLNDFLPPYPTQPKGKAEATLATPATIALNWDNGWTTADGVEYDFREVRGSCRRKIAGSTRHGDGGNYSFVDGHVKWLTPEEFAETECKNGPLPLPFKD